MNLSNEKIMTVLPKLEKGLSQYIELMDEYLITNVSEDENFQRKYNHFYRMRQRSKEYYSEYYKLMEVAKKTNLEFEDVIKHIFIYTGRVEPSFSSKLLATANPNKPVWDKFVLENLGIKVPSYGGNKDRRIEKLIKIYKEIENWYNEYLSAKESYEAIRLFDEFYPDKKITDLKKIDLILWQNWQ